MTVEEFAALVLAQTRERMARLYSQEQADWETVEVIPGRVYTKVNLGPKSNMAGRYMVENATGNVYGIKGYGKVHKGHFYGTLDTVDQWYWGDFYPMKLQRFLFYVYSNAGTVEVRGTDLGSAVREYEQSTGDHVAAASAWTTSKAHPAGQWESADAILKVIRRG